MPMYHVFTPNSEGVYKQGKPSPVLYITEKDSESMLLKKDIEFFVKDSIKNKDIFTARGMFLHPSAELRQKYSSFETVPEESTRVFFYVEDYSQYVKNIIGDSTFIMQNNHMYLTILKDYSEVFIYCKGIDGKFEQKYTFTPCTQDNESLNLYHVVMGAYGNAYCSTSDEKLIKVNPKTGKILKQYSWLPGIILTGCDFTGTEISEHLRNILYEHGARS